MTNTTDLKLIFVLKNGVNSKGEGLYEFIFCKDPSSVDTVAWGWDAMPASYNAQPPDEVHTDSILLLKTNKIELICLHELNDRAYLDGYYAIHALAYQDYNDDSSDLMYDELPILVFHFGMTMKEVKDILYTRDLIVKEVKPEKLTTNTEQVVIDDHDSDYDVDDDPNELIV